MAAPPCSQKSLLADFTGLFVVLQHAQTQIEDAALMSLYEEGKGILIPMSIGFHKLRVVLLGGRRRDAREG